MSSADDVGEEEALAVRLRSVKTSVLPRPPVQPKPASPPDEAKVFALAQRAGAEGERWRSATEEEHEPDGPPGSRPPSQYIGELAWQVDKVVYCGGIKAVQNLNLLCRLNIEYIVDLTGEDAQSLAR